MAIAEIAIPGDHSTAAAYHRPQCHSTTLSADSATWWSRAAPAGDHRHFSTDCAGQVALQASADTRWCRAQGALMGRIKLAPTCTHWPLQYMASARFAVHTLAGGGKKVKGLRGGAVVEHLSRARRAGTLVPHSTPGSRHHGSSRSKCIPVHDHSEHPLRPGWLALPPKTIETLGTDPASQRAHRNPCWVWSADVPWNNNNTNTTVAAID